MQPAPHSSANSAGTFENRGRTSPHEPLQQNIHAVQHRTQRDGGPEARTPAHTRDQLRRLTRWWLTTKTRTTNDMRNRPSTPSQLTSESRIALSATN
jgi:hypothetical protein